MLTTIALVTAGVSLALHLGKWLAKKTKTTKDDKLVAWLESVAPYLIEIYERETAAKEVKPAPREKVIDHRSPGK